MELIDQISLRNDNKMFMYLMENSLYIREFDRGNIDYKTFVNLMKLKYKERTSDKINSLIDNIDMLSSVLNVLK
jgi:hypothetical protein